MIILLLPNKDEYLICNARHLLFDIPDGQLILIPAQLDRQRIRAHIGQRDLAREGSHRSGHQNGDLPGRTHALSVLDVALE